MKGDAVRKSRPDDTRFYEATKETEIERKSVADEVPPIAKMEALIEEGARRYADLVVDWMNIGVFAVDASYPGGDEDGRSEVWYSVDEEVEDLPEQPRSSRKRASSSPPA